MASGGGAIGEQEPGPEAGVFLDYLSSVSSPFATQFPHQDLLALEQERRSMAIGGAIGEQEPGPEAGVFLDFLAAGVSSRPRSYLPRAAPSQPWGNRLPVLPPAPAKKKPAKKKAKKTAAGKKRLGRQCEHCGATETPLWRTSPTDSRVKLCNACGIKARTTPGAAVLPELAHLPPLATATAAVGEPSHPPPREIQEDSEPDSPIFESLLDFDVYLVKRTSSTRRSDKPVRWYVHCGSTTTRGQWRTGPLGRATLCNACGMCYRKDGLVPEYRPAASPTFNPAEHSCKQREVLQIREMLDSPAPPAPFQPCGNRKRRNKGYGKAKGKGRSQPAAQPAGVAAAVLQVRKKKGKAQRLALLNLRMDRKGKGPQHRRPTPPAATPPPHAGDGIGMVQQHLPIPPPPALLPHAGDGMVLQHLPPPSPLTLLLQAASDIEMEVEQHLMPLLQALPHAGDEVMMGDEPIPPPDPFLFDGPAAPRIIDDDDERPWQSDRDRRRLASWGPRLAHDNQSS